MITITEGAGSHISAMLENRGKGVGIRLGIQTSGCTGYAYLIEFVDHKQQEDYMFEAHGIKIFVDTKSMIFLDGTEVDYVTEGLNSGLKFNNPNIKDECGCGESFNI